MATFLLIMCTLALSAFVVSLIVFHFSQRRKARLTNPHDSHRRSARR